MNQSTMAACAFRSSCLKRYRVGGLKANGRAVDMLWTSQAAGRWVANNESVQPAPRDRG